MSSLPERAFKGIIGITSTRKRRDDSALITDGRCCNFCTQESLPPDSGAIGFCVDFVTDRANSRRRLAGGWTSHHVGISFGCGRIGSNNRQIYRPNCKLYPPRSSLMRNVSRKAVPIALVSQFGLAAILFAVLALRTPPD